MADLSMKRIAGNQKRLMELAAQWDEVDNGTMWALQEVADKVEAVSDEMQAFVK